MMKKLILFLILLSAQVSKSQTLYHLEESSAFPQETDSLLWSNPSDIKFVGDEIFVLDYALNALMKYTKEGQLLALIDAKGQGPGEFVDPTSFDYGSGKIYLPDPAQARINIFKSSDFAFISMFKVLQPLMMDIAVADEQIYLLNLSPSLEENGFSFIETYNTSGKLVKQLGKPFPFVPQEKLSKFAFEFSHMGEIKMYNDKLYYLSKHFPIMRIYNLDGTLNQALDMELDDAFTQRLQDNYDWESIAKNPNGLKMSGIFESFYVNEQGVFALMNLQESKKLRIDHYGFDGKRLGIYTDDMTCGEEACNIAEFVVTLEGNRPEFHVLYSSPYPKLSHYKVTGSEVLQGGKSEKSTAWYFILVIGLLVGGFFIFRRMQQRKQVA